MRCQPARIALRPILPKLCPGLAPAAMSAAKGVGIMPLLVMEVPGLLAARAVPADRARHVDVNGGG